MQSEIIKSIKKNMNKYSTKLFVLLLVMSLMMAISACNVGADSATGTFAIQMHDNAADFEEVNIHVKQVEIRTANKGDWKTIGKPDKVYNLLELINGDMALLGEQQVDSDRYTKLRIVFGNDNSITVNGQNENLDVPEEAKINIGVTIGGGDEFTLHLDVDASRIEQTEAGYQLNPLIRAYEKNKTGTITGRVSPAERVLVSAKLADTTFASTYADETTGEFRLLGLDFNTYSIEVVPSSNDFNSVELSNVILNGGFTAKQLGTFGLAPSDLFANEHWTRRLLEPGIELLQRHYNYNGAPRYISILAVDPNEPRTEIRFASTYNKSSYRIPISDFGKQAQAVAATNAGFGPGGSAYWQSFHNYGILKIDGEIIPYFNFDPEDEEIWSERSGLKFMGSSAVGIDVADNWHFRERESDSWSDDWPEVEHAIAGGHMLISDGVIKENIANEEYNSTKERNHIVRDHPRTAICQTEEGVIALFAVDGRQTYRAVGMPLKELAEYMLELGCVDAINFDGGGSTTMWTGEHGVVNHPTDNGNFDNQGERNLRSAIIIDSN